MAMSTSVLPEPNYFLVTNMVIETQHANEYSILYKTKNFGC